MKIINYRLHAPGKDYSALYEAIKNLSGTFWHNTTSSWLVETALSPESIYNRLKPHIDSNDELVIFGLREGWYGQLKPDDLKWLESRGF